MKKDIHPKYYDTIITCSCGASFKTGSTMKDLKTEICSSCHPFFTGQQKLIDSAGQVDKFMKKVKKAQEFKAKTVKEVKKEETEEVVKKTAKGRKKAE